MPLTTTSPKADIQQFQLDLQLLGYSLRNSKADGVLGPITKGAAHDFADDQKITDKFDGTIPDSVLTKVKELAAKKRNPEINLPTNFYDFTNVAWPGPRKYERPWNKITSITVHQTGCNLTDDLKKAKRWYYFENVNKEGVRSVDSLHAHAGITKTGNVYLIHPFNQFVWHAQGLSHAGIGMEINGCFNGIADDIKTFPKGAKKPSRLTPEQIEASKNFIRYVKKILESHGSELKNLIPHRCASNTRRPDCGEEIYKSIVTPMIEELGLEKVEKDFKLGKGFTIPEQWDEFYKGNEY